MPRHKEPASPGLLLDGDRDPEGLTQRKVVVADGEQQQLLHLIGRAEIPRERRFGSQNALGDINGSTDQQCRTSSCKLDCLSPATDICRTAIRHPLLHGCPQMLALNGIHELHERLGGPLDQWRDVGW